MWQGMWFIYWPRQFPNPIHGFQVEIYALLESHNWIYMTTYVSLQWRHNEGVGVSNHQPHDCLFNRLFRCRSKKTSKLRVTGLFAGNSPVTGEFHAQMASNTENVSIWWRHHVQFNFPHSLLCFVPRRLPLFKMEPHCHHHFSLMSKTLLGWRFLNL